MVSMSTIRIIGAVFFSIALYISAVHKKDTDTSVAIVVMAIAFFLLTRALA